MFELVEGDEYRQDLRLFQEEAEPLAESMLDQLSEIVSNQQDSLASELQAARPQSQFGAVADAIRRNTSDGCWYPYGQTLAAANR